MRRHVSQWPPLRRLETTLAWTAAAVLLFMMALTVADVVLRYAFARPIRQAFEVTELSLAVLIFLGLPAVSLHGAHITTDLIDRYLPAGAMAALRRVVDLVCGVSAGALALLLARRAGSVAQSGDKTPVAGIELAPWVWGIAAMLALTAIVHLVRCAWPGDLADASSAGEGSAGG